MEETENGNFLIRRLRHWAEVQPDKEQCLLILLLCRLHSVIVTIPEKKWLAALIL